MQNTFIHVFEPSTNIAGPAIINHEYDDAMQESVYVCLSVCVVVHIDG